MVMKTKNITRTFFAASLALLLVLSCKKKDKTPSAYELLQGRWTFRNVGIKVFNNNTNVLIATQTYPATPGDYAEFRSDNKVYIQLGGLKDTSSYSLTTDTQLLLIDGSNRDTANINLLNSKNLVFVLKDIDNITIPPEREESTYTFEK
jgi:hypothetical protein